MFRPALSAITSIVNWALIGFLAIAFFGSDAFGGDDKADVGVIVIGSGSDGRPVTAPGQSFSFNVGVDNMNGKADAQLDMNMPEEAHTSYEQALAYDPNSFQAWNGLGNARSSMRDYQGAVEAYTRALLVNPRSAVAWCNKAEALIRLGHNRAALDALNEATEMDSRYARAWTLKGNVYEALGNYQEAQKARKRAKPWGLMN